LKILIPVSLGRADKIVGVSKFTADEIVGYYKIDPKKVTWIYNAVSDDFLKLAGGGRNISDDEIKKIKEKYHLPEKYILYIGTLQPRKNLSLLIEAYKTVKEKVPGIKLVLAGGRGHNYDRNIDVLVKKYDLGSDVVLPGYVAEKDKAPLMKGAQVFCLPSLYEGFGIPILEAMSVEIPVVASDISSQREVAGEAALFFNPKNPAELAQKLEISLNDEEIRNSLIAKGKERLKIFSWRVSAEKLLDIFSKFE
jgi:glycosyltransferase involved in cell wall biosynthesis